mgnify:CR=1 FL=1
MEARDSEFVDRKSGVSARVAIGALESVVSAAERRALYNNEQHTMVRIGDLFAVVPAITGKIELVYEGEQEGPEKVAQHLICLLYTSDAADERSSVDLGGRRIIKKKKREETESLCSTTS